MSVAAIDRPADTTDLYRLLYGLLPYLQALPRLLMDLQQALSRLQVQVQVDPRDLVQVEVPTVQVPSLDLGPVIEALGRLQQAVEKPQQVKRTIVTGPGVVGLQEAEAQLLRDIRNRVNDWEVRFDYDVRTDKNPVYIGRAPQGTPTDAPVWVVQRFTWQDSPATRPTRIEVRTTSWDDRATGW